MFCQLICPNLRCRKVLKVPEEARGKVVRCQYCQTMLRVPPPRRVEDPTPSTTASTTATTGATGALATPPAASSR
jgi:LSD1 subclass zinc finger protein